MSEEEFDDELENEEYEDEDEEDEDEDEDDDDWSPRRAEVGKEVQAYTDDGLVDGFLQSIIPAQRARPSNYWELPEEEVVTWTERAQLKLVDGSILIIDAQSVEARDTPLEREFRLHEEAASKRIHDKLAEASQLISEACDIAEETGIPFDGNCSHISNTYYPESFGKKFPKLSTKFMESITDTYNEYPGEAGWRHSQAGC